MPSDVYSTLHAFTAPAPNMEEYAIFGGILPLPETALPWLGWAVVLLLVAGLFHRRLPPLALKALLSVGVLTAYWGVFVLSTRWLDDVFINLIHPYNLFHHHRFSTRMDSMANGTVEILYYALLTPFAGDRITLIRADYAFGALIGVGHLIALHYLLRRVPLLARFFVLAVFAAWVPIVQAFSSGYGNGVVTLLWLLGVIAVVEDKRARLAAFCALMPLFRPDALLYSFSLAGMYFLVHRRFALRYWIPTLLSPVLYALMVHQLYGQWVPTPIVFKRASVLEIIGAFPAALSDLWANYLLGSPERLLLIVLGAIYFLVPPRHEHGLRPRTVTALLLSSVPILLFFYTTGQFGYNPTNYRYYAIFDISLFLAGALGLLALVERLPEYTTPSLANLTTASSSPLLHRAARVLPALALLLIYANISRSIKVAEFKDWEGNDIGISCGFYDLKRMSDLRFGGVYFARVVPEGWEIAATEMDTFGFFGGREIIDLWGFSNLRIAQSNEKTNTGVRRNSTFFMQSDAPVFWVRTMSKNDPEYKLHDRLESNDPLTFERGLWIFPNLSRRFRQAGILDTTLQKYDVVRILHGESEISILLVRKDLAGAFCDALVRGGATPAGTIRLPLTP